MKKLYLFLIILILCSCQPVTSQETPLNLIKVENEAQLSKTQRQIRTDECLREYSHSSRNQFQMLKNSSSPDSISVFEFLKQDLKTTVPRRFTNEMTKLIKRMKLGLTIESFAELERESKVFKDNSIVFDSEKSQSILVVLLNRLSQLDDYQEVIDRGLHLNDIYFLPNQPVVTFC